MFVGPNMQNFEDIVEQIEATAHQQLAPHAPVEPVIHSIQDPSDLASELHRHFMHADTSAASPPPKNRQHQQMMRSLAVHSLRAHEQKLLEWISQCEM